MQMGGRGGASGLAPKANNSTQSKEALLNKSEQDKKLPSVGAKVQTAYIDYVKQQINIDLSKARDTQFDNRNGFNIDTSKLTPSQLAQVKTLANKYPGGYDVQFMDNGAKRLYIRVRRRK